MTREELFDLLEIDVPEDFEYFEQFADLIESEEEIDFGDFYVVLSAIKGEDLAEINENYFTEIEKNFPDNCDDVLEVVENVWGSLKLLYPDLDDEECRRNYAQQLFKFHEWYVDETKAKVDNNPCSVMAALCEFRASKLDHCEHTYDFDDAIDYDFDDISIRLGGYES